MADFSSMARVYIAAFSILYLVGISRNSVEAAPTVTAKKTNTEMDYLIKYGYLSKSTGTGKLMSQEDLAQSLRSLQRFAGLNETGRLDAATIALMGQPRCGVPDISSADKARRRRRYVLQGTHWKKKGLTYRIKTFTRDLANADQERIIKWAFDQWSQASKISVTEAPLSMSDDKVDIVIKFVRGAHGDSYPFDGPGGTLAHAFYPHDNSGISGDAHFDDDESFTTGQRKGVNLDWVALHEFGHSLGLDHSTVRDSVMYPWYKGFVENIKLTRDDVRGIQALYGEMDIPLSQSFSSLRSGSPPESRYSEPPEKDKEATDQPFTRGKRPLKPAIDECEVKRFDAWVYSSVEEKTYAFVGDYYFTVDPNTVGVISGPLKIVDKWREVRTPIDAAYTRRDGRIVFFREGTYWKYYGSFREEGPKPITDYGLPKELEKMNGAFIWGRNSRTYFWKGNKYWRYDERYRKVDPGYPKDVSIWKKIPAGIDTVMKWKNEKTYFFKGTQYYKLDDYAIESEQGYPKNVAHVWMKCDQIRSKVVHTTASPTVNDTFVNTTRGYVKSTQEGASVGYHALPSILMFTLGVITAIFSATS